MTPYRAVKQNIDSLFELQSDLEFTAMALAGKLYDSPSSELREIMQRAKDNARSINNKIHVYFEGSIKPNGAHEERDHETKLIHKAKVAVRYLRLAIYHYDKEQEEKK